MKNLVQTCELWVPLGAEHAIQRFPGGLGVRGELSQASRCRSCSRSGWRAASWVCENVLAGASVPAGHSDRHHFVLTPPYIEGNANSLFTPRRRPPQGQHETRQEQPALPAGTYPGSHGLLLLQQKAVRQPTACRERRQQPGLPASSRSLTPVRRPHDAREATPALVRRHHPTIYRTLGGAILR
jgi:hypothetical protein